jgi:hypothetical protein
LSGWGPARAIALNIDLQAQGRQAQRQPLEADEVEDLIDAAGQLDHPLSRPHTERLGADIVQLRDGAKLAWKAVAARLGISGGYAFYLFLERPEQDSNLRPTP